MEVLTLTVFASVALVVAALLFFAWNVRLGSHEHAERLALLPLQQEPSTPAEQGHGDRPEEAR